MPGRRGSGARITEPFFAGPLLGGPLGSFPRISLQSNSDGAPAQQAAGHSKIIILYNCYWRNARYLTHSPCRWILDSYNKIDLKEC